MNIYGASNENKGVLLVGIYSIITLPIIASLICMLVTIHEDTPFCFNNEDVFINGIMGYIISLVIMIILLACGAWLINYREISKYSIKSNIKNINTSIVTSVHKSPTSMVFTDSFTKPQTVSSKEENVSIVRKYMPQSTNSVTIGDNIEIDNNKMKSTPKHGKEKVRQEDKDNQEVKRDFNIAAKILLVLNLIGSIISIVTTTITMLNYHYYDEIFEIMFYVFVVAASIGTLFKQPGGLIVLIILYVVRLFIVFPGYGNAPYSYIFGANIAYVMRDFGLFAIAMCFKKGGVSGWKSMLSNI